MKLLQIGKTGILSLAVAAAAGAAIIVFAPRWTFLVGVAFVLLATGIFIGAQTAHSQRQYHFTPEPKVTGEKASGRLVVLSSAAVLAVYSAGYFRTRSAANRLTERPTQQRVGALVSGTVSLPTLPEVKTDPAAQPPATPQTDALPRRTVPAEVGAPSTSSASIDASKRAPAPARPKKAPSTSPDEASSSRPETSQTGYKDGIYLGWGSCPHGDIQTAVKIKRGQIVDTAIAQCLTRYSCSVIKQAPGQVIARQSIEVDYVSGATQSVDAFRDAVADALSKALSGSK